MIDPGGDDDLIAAWQGRLPAAAYAASHAAFELY
ncbi:hypothetical protein ABAC460_18750 [Asticcacaulis sp. AC460]|nr:hypothetical protein ABAC460_18750 [Asticcacaulis sp. AC460]